MSGEARPFRRPPQKIDAARCVGGETSEVSDNDAASRVKNPAAFRKSTAFPPIGRPSRGQICRCGRLACESFKQNTEKNVETIRTECLKLQEKGVESLHLRVDVGYGGGIIDALRIDSELIKAFDEYEVFDSFRNCIN